MSILIRRGEEQYGPYTLEEARGYVGEGRIVIEDLASLDGANWRPLGELVPELKASAPTLVSAPPPPGRYPPGDVLSRFGAALIDILVACLFLVPGALSLAARFDEGYDDDVVWMFVVGGIVAVGYLLVKDGFRGRSLGKLATGLMVVHLPTDTPCGIGRSAIRTLVFYFSNMIPLVGSLIEPLLVIATPDRRRLGDRAASTQVIGVTDYRGGTPA